jgi:hypothetical protein
VDSSKESIQPVGLPEPVPRVRRNSHNNPPSSNGSKNGIAAVGAKAVIDVEGLLRADPVTSIDLAAALKTTKPSSDGKMTKYVLSNLEAAVLLYVMQTMGRKRIEIFHFFFITLMSLPFLLPSLQVYCLAE